jgi:CubicO group peptidase (beta-lactamase class C family)
MNQTFPNSEWETKSPGDLLFDPDKLSDVKTWLQEEAQDANYQVGIARYGYLAAEWGQGIKPGARLAQASAAKSYYSSLLGIIVAEGKLPSPDARVVDYYPEMMAVGEQEGPKPGRFAFEKDRDITFRQLICNVSGYMKPGEEPGKVFHYQTYGMNIFTHAMASIYGYYDVNDPEGLPGCGRLLEEKLRDPIKGTWTHSYANFDLWDNAKLNIFGYYTQVQTSLRDQLRVGHLWLNYGNWDGTQVIPETYLKEATVTNPFILQNEPEENWKYGHGFWCNDHGKQWPDAPRDSFAASGAGAKHIWMCPRLGLVITQNPGFWNHFKEEQQKTASQNEVILRILGAIRP